MRGNVVGYPIIDIAPLRIELLYPLRPIGTGGWERYVVESRVTVRQEGFQGRVRGQLDLAEIIYLYRTLRKLDRLVGQEAGEQYILDDESGLHGELRVKLALTLPPSVYVTVEAELCADRDCETLIKARGAHDQTWIRIWMEQISEAVKWYLPDFDPIARSYPRAWWDKPTTGE